MKNTRVFYHAMIIFFFGYEQMLCQARYTPNRKKIIERFDLRWNRRTYVEYNKDAITSFAVYALLMMAIANPILFQFTLKLFAELIGQFISAFSSHFYLPY